MQTYGKRGQGAFNLAVFEPGDNRTGVEVSFPDRDSPTCFDNVQAAYDYYREAFDQTRHHAYWNVCYHLQDHLTTA